MEPIHSGRQCWRRKMSSIRCPVSDARPVNTGIGQRISDNGRPLLVGIAWQGSPTYRYDRQRSIPLSRSARLGEAPGVQLVSLQKGTGADQLGAVATHTPILDLNTRLDEAAGAFTDTAAVMENLDLVIASDTSIPHLAGSLGVRCGSRCPGCPTGAGCWTARTIPGILRCVCFGKRTAATGTPCSAHDRGID